MLANSARKQCLQTVLANNAAYMHRYGDFQRRAARETAAKLAASSAAAEESMSNIRLIKAHGYERESLRRYRGQLDALANIDYRTAAAYAVRPCPRPSLASTHFWGHTLLPRAAHTSGGTRSSPEREVHSFTSLQTCNFQCSEDRKRAPSAVNMCKHAAVSSYSAWRMGTLLVLPIGKGTISLR